MPGGQLITKGETELAALTERLGLVVSATGRSLEDGRRMIALDGAARDLDCDARRSACALPAVTAESPRPVIEDADVLVRATPGVDEVLTRLLAAVEG